MSRYFPIIIALSLIVTILVTSNYVNATILTFGLTSNDASTQTNSADRKYIYQAIPSSNGKVTAGTARVWLSTTGLSSSNLVIYADNAGSPDALLAVSDLVAISNTSEQAIDYTFSGANQITVASGTPYWVGVHFSDPGVANFTISRANNVGLVRSDPDTYLDGPADPCACATVSNGGLNVYISYDDTPAIGSSTFSSTQVSGGINTSGGIIIR